MNLNKLQNKKNLSCVIFGNHPQTIQSMLDFDYICRKKEPCIKAIVGVGKQSHRFFWGNKEIIIPGYLNLDEMPKDLRHGFDLFTVVSSARRVSEIIDSLDLLPNIKLGTIFAEGVTERHAIEIRNKSLDKKVLTLGPASVGFLAGGKIKIGAIGGTFPDQIYKTNIYTSGSVAIISTSGGMTNELINLVIHYGGRISFAAAVGGERYPISKPIDLIKMAFEDPNTKTILFFGEVGGKDEYEIAEYYKSNREKKLICYVAGKAAEAFEDPPQFGHAKALAQSLDESASAKRKALSQSGALCANSFKEFENLILSNIEKVNEVTKIDREILNNRKQKAFVSSVSSDKGEDIEILGKQLLDFIDGKSLSYLALSMFLGKEPNSKELADFIDTSMKLLIDHGPQVSGAVNTIITARAGKDLPSALSAGLLTIGPKFGGAINESADCWLQAVKNQVNPADFVEEFAKQRKYIPGIGHKKYRIDNPDPRVSTMSHKFKKGKYTDFALEVEKITLKKNPNLILNVDGFIASMVLDLLENNEGYEYEELHKVVDSGFFNAIFVLARSIGFISHYLDQNRLDEGLFRLDDDQILNIQNI